MRSEYLRITPLRRGSRCSQQAGDGTHGLCGDDNHRVTGNTGNDLIGGIFLPYLPPTFARLHREEPPHQLGFRRRIGAELENA